MLRPKDDMIDAILDAIDDAGSIALQDLYLDVADRLALSDAELAEQASSNGMLAYQDQISWLLTALTQEGTLHRPDRAVYARFDGPRIRVRDLTDRAAVDAALGEFDRIGREAFLEKYGFGEAREYFVVTDRGRYDSKAVFAAAWLREHDMHLTPAHFSGGRHGAGGRLAQLGFTIENDQRRPLAASAGRSRAARPATAVREPEHCPTCSMALPVSKICDFC